MKRRLLQAIGTLLLVTVLYAGYSAWNNNFHTVIPGELYRSGQLGSGEIAQYSKRYGLKTVLNLRGDNTGSPWYDNEVKETADAKVKHLDFRMSAKQKLTPEQAKQLIAIMRDAPKPLLVHCNGGANRTSLASALYLASVKGADESTAEAQLSPIYGNFPQWMGSKSVMSANFHELEPMLGYGTR